MLKSVNGHKSICCASCNTIGSHVQLTLLHVQLTSQKKIPLSPSGSMLSVIVVDMAIIHKGQLLGQTVLLYKDNAGDESEWCFLGDPECSLSH